MIIIDYSQICIAAMFANGGGDIDEDFFRHVVLNSIRSIKTKFNNYGQIVLAVDAGVSWRKKEFPYYKSNRKKAREDSNIDWNKIFGFIETIKTEIDENFNYKVIQVKNAEADDIIGTLISEKLDENNIIISGDKDFIQLQKYPNVKQYNNIDNKYIEGNGEEYLKEHILKGDVGDGIPNAMMEDNVLVVKIRQKPVTKKKIEEFYNGNTSLFPFYDRNKKLIDLSFTPQDIKQNILNEFNKEKTIKNDLTNYFMAKGLMNLFSNINDF